MVNSSDQRYMDQPDLVHLVPSNGATNRADTTARADGDQELCIIHSWGTR